MLPTRPVPPPNCVAFDVRAQHGIELAKQKIVLDEPIKGYGNYELKAKLGYEVTGKIYVMVVEEK